MTVLACADCGVVPNPACNCQKPSSGGAVAKLRAARTAWHKGGVPISEEYANFLDAIGEVEDGHVVLLEALRKISEVANDTTIAWESRLYQVKRLSREAIKETESL